MKFVILVAHGSRQAEQNDVFVQVIDLIREILDDEYSIDGAFMSFSEMNIETKLKEVIDKGAKEIIIVPYLLFAGNHVIETIPKKVDSFMKNYPDVKIIYKESFGADKRLAEIIVDRIKN